MSYNTLELTILPIPAIWGMLKKGRPQEALAAIRRWHRSETLPAGDWDSLLAYLDVLVLYAKSREAELRKKADLKASRAFGEEMTQFARMILKVRGHYIPSWIFDLTEAAFRALGRRV